MFRKNYYIFLLTAALFLTGSVAAFAQAGMARGTVQIKKADGSVVPVADAVVDVYRTDIKGKLPSAKTNKKGEFTVLGMLPGGRYVLSISAPGIRSEIAPGVKMGDEKVIVNAVEGDGKPLTEEEARGLIDSAPATNGQTKELTAEQKKQQEEQAKQQAKYEAEKKKVDNINEVVNKSLTDGSKAFNEGNYDLAIAKYDEGINADPDFEGSAPVLLNNKAVALINLAIRKYNAAVKGDAAAKSAALDLVKKDLTDSLTASTKSLEILKTATSTDAKAQKAYAIEKTRAYQNSVNTYGRMFSMNVETTKGKEALTALEEYSAIETDAAKKTQWQLFLADGFRQAGDSPSAIIAYRKVMETTPENPDALAGLGLSLFSVGASATPADTAQMQEGLNLMQRFSEIAPETHPLKASVKDAVEYLKTQQLAPQKTTKPAKKKT